MMTAGILSGLLLAAVQLPADGRWQILWDDAIVDEAKSTVTRRLHAPRFAGVAMTHDAPWEGDGCNYHNILGDEDAQGVLYRMYYLGWAMGAGAWKDTGKVRPIGIRICYAESRDGLVWTKPDLGLRNVGTNRHTNVILDGHDNAWDNFMVFKDANPACPKDELYKGVCSYQVKLDKDGRPDPNGKTDRGLWCFVSADGIRFKRGWCLTKKGAFDSLNVAFWDPDRRLYHVYYRVQYGVKNDRYGDNNVRGSRHIVSKDFHTWDEGENIRFGTQEDYPLYTSGVEPYLRAPDVFVGFPMRYVERKEWTPNYDSLPDAERRKARSKVSKRYGLVLTDTAFMWSRDGVRFNREDEAFLRPGPERPDSWTYGSACAARGLVVTPGWRGGDEEISMYFNDGHWSGRPATLDRYVIRMDGFVSRHATYEPQTLVTKPFTFAGDTLEINFATSARGFLRVEARAADGSAAVSDDLFGDSTHRNVAFVKGDLKTLAGKPVTLTFTMSDADLYSFRFR